jgi:arylsulfatase A-like enzyme
LTGDVNYLAKNPKTAEAFAKDPDRPRLIGLVSNPELVEDWKKSAGFAEDTVILRKIYEASASHMDEFMKDVLNLWGDEELQKNTIVILTGDHGEMTMAHGELSHATALFESALRFPFLMRFPGQSGGIEQRSEQMQLASVAFMLEDLMNGSLLPDQMDKFWPQWHEPVMVLRDCTNKLRGVRVNNEWKYFVRTADGERFLFNLKKDPDERTNLASRMPDKTDELERLYWANYENFAGVPWKHCAPSALAE